MRVTLPICVAVLALTFDHRFGGGTRGLFSISIFEIAATLAILWLAANLVYAGRSGVEAVSGRLYARYRAPLIYVGIALGFSAAGYLAGSADGLHGVRDMLGGVFLGISITGSLDRRDQLGIVELALAAAVGLVSILAMSQALFGGPYLRALDENAYFKHALGGIDLVTHPVVGSMTHPNSFAVFLGPLTVLCAGSARSSGRRGGPSVALWVASGLGAIALVCTHAKMAAAVFLVMTLWAVVASVTPHYSHRRGLLSWIAVCVGLVAVATGLIALAASAPDWAAPGTLLERAYLDAKAVETIVGSVKVFVLGGAIESFREFTPIGLGVHNEYLHQALRYGIGTALAFVWLLAESLRLDRRIGWGLAPAVVGITAIFLVEPAAGAQLQGMLFFVLAYIATVSALATDAIS